MAARRYKTKRGNYTREQFSVTGAAGAVTRAWRDGRLKLRPAPAAADIVVGRVRHVETAGDSVAPRFFWRGRYASIDG